jgi:hypothetical protein
MGERERDVKKREGGREKVAMRERKRHVRCKSYDKLSLHFYHFVEKVSLKKIATQKRSNFKIQLRLSVTGMSNLVTDIFALGDKKL